MPRSLAEITRQIDDLLATDQEVPEELILDLLCAMSERERRCWFATMVRLAQGGWMSV